MPSRVQSMSTTLTTATFVGVLGAGIVGGVFYAFSTFVMPGLQRLPDRDGLAAMQQINVTAEHPAFMLAFMGTTLLCLYLGVRGVMDLSSTTGKLLVAGSALYLAGAFLRTGSYNVPLNNELADISPHAANAAQHWQHYLDQWNWANHLRGAASIGAAAAYMGALLV
jgi:uncharacterized membrane protein